MEEDHWTMANSTRMAAVFLVHRDQDTSFNIYLANLHSQPCSLATNGKVLGVGSQFNFARTPA